jgi:ankyrin repeat protein
MNRLSKIPLYLLLSVTHTHARSRCGSNVGFTVVWRLPVLCVLACFVMPPLLLATHGQTKSASCETALIRAIRWRKWEDMRRLIRTGADLNERACPEGNSPLFEALGSDSGIAKEIIEAGADPNGANAGGGTPIMAASFYCEEEIVLLLLKKGAHVNATDSGGFTALTQASQECTDGRIIGLLIHAGASVHARTKGGETPLSIAAFSGNESAVIQLVCAGADIKAETTDGETPLMVAENRKEGRQPSHDRIAKFLHEIEILSPD